MPRRAKELSSVELRRLKTRGQYAVGGVAGLCLRVGDGEARSWVLRYMDGVRRAEMGLGSFPEIDLATAREKAKAIRAALRHGERPALTRGRHRVAGVPTFKEATRRYLVAKQGEWKSAKHGQQWANTLTTYAHPVIGPTPVNRISREAVLTVLEPIWRVKTETAKRVRERIESVLDYSKGHGWREGDNPAAWAGGLKGLLPDPRRIAPVENHPALDWREAPAYMAELRTVDAMSARCLEFLILTAARFSQASGATWAEIDLRERLWRVPGARMKGRKGSEKTHIVPLSQPAIRLLESLPRINGSELVFPSPHLGKRLSDVAVSKVAKRIRAGITVHGFRSTFRTWAGEATHFPREVLEQALAHSVGNAVESAYARGDLLEKRKALMGDWAKYLEKPSASVVSIRAADRDGK
jgi:integrase